MRANPRPFTAISFSAQKKPCRDSLSDALTGVADASAAGGTLDKTIVQGQDEASTVQASSCAIGMFTVNAIDPQMKNNESCSKYMRMNSWI